MILTTSNLSGIVTLCAEAVVHICFMDTQEFAIYINRHMKNGAKHLETNIVKYNFAAHEQILMILTTSNLSGIVT